MPRDCIHDSFPHFLNLWHAGPRISAPCIPCTRASLGRLQSLPRSDTHLPRKGPPGQRRLDPVQAVRRTAWKGHWVHAVQTSVSARSPGNRGHYLEHQEPQKREQILAFVGVCGHGMRKDRRCSELALSARPEHRVFASLSATSDKVEVCRLAGPSPSGCERAELSPCPRPSLGSSPPGV